MINNTPQEIWTKLKKCKKVLLVLHNSPDGDSMGSNYSMKYVLERDLKINATVIASDPPSNDLKSMDFYKEVLFQKDLANYKLSSYDAVICIDNSDEKRMSRVNTDYSFPKDIFVINIDHHATNTYFGKLNIVLPEASSSCEVLLDFFRSLEIKIDKTLAKSLALGIYTDTGFLRWGFQGSSKVLKDMAYLVDQGLDLEKELIRPLSKQTMIQKKLLGLVYSNLKFEPKLQFGYVVIPLKQWQALGLKDEDVGGTSNSIQDLENALFIFTMIEHDDRISLSFRSRADVDVSLFASEFGGGGHKAASGAKLPKMPLADAEKKVLEVIKKVGIHKV